MSKFIPDNDKYTGNFKINTSIKISWVIECSISILIIACPCAIGLAIPIAVIIGSGISSKHGIVIKSGETMEKMNKIDTIVFDKTGTLTKGEHCV
jgi:Cu+-exporting ATPase